MLKDLNIVSGTKLPVFFPSRPFRASEVCMCGDTGGAQHEAYEPVPGGPVIDHYEEVPGGPVIDHSEISSSCAHCGHPLRPLPDKRVPGRDFIIPGPGSRFI